MNVLSGVAIDEGGDVHVATNSGVKIFPSKTSFGSRVQCDDVVIGPGNCKFVSFRHDACLEIYKADNTLVGTIHGLRCCFRSLFGSKWIHLCCRLLWI